jgi:glucokinase
VNVFDPSLVLLGGGAGVNAAKELVPPMRAEMEARIVGRRPAPPIAIASLGDDAGMIGAALIASGQHKGEPT